jgi:acyl-CoA thioesterase-2
MKPVDRGNRIAAQLALEAVEMDLFRGLPSPRVERGIYGGVLIGQSLAAAERTVEGRAPHSLHAYFLLPGDSDAPILYQVERTRDGGSFSTRRVQAVQRGRAIFSMIASFQVAEQGFEHASDMPAVPPPEQLTDTAELAQGWFAEEGAAEGQVLAEWLSRTDFIEARPVAPSNPLRPTRQPPQRALWFRVGEHLGENPAVHRCLLAYATDYSLLATALRPHGRSGVRRDLFVASLDHALWFHRPARVDEWLLYSMDSPSAQDGRGLVRGQIFDRAGRLVASIAQEGLIRDLAAAAPSR